MSITTSMVDRQFSLITQMQGFFACSTMCSPEENDNSTIFTVFENNAKVNPHIGDYLWFPDREDLIDKRYKIVDVSYDTTAMDEIEEEIPIILITINSIIENSETITDVLFLSFSDELVAGVNPQKYGANRFPLVLLDKGNPVLAKAEKRAVIGFTFPFAVFDTTNKTSEEINENRIQDIFDYIVDNLYCSIIDEIQVINGYFINGSKVKGYATIIETK